MSLPRLSDNMEDHCPAVDVLKVEDVVESSWFKAALVDHGTAADAVVVLAHMDAEDPLVRCGHRQFKRVRFPAFNLHFGMSRIFE